MVALLPRNPVLAALTLFSAFWCSTVAGAQPPASADSLTALFNAKAAMRTFERRWRSEIASNVTVPTIAPFANCEIRIGYGYCYGPRNGRISYTQPGTMPNAARFARDLVPAVARRKARALLSGVIDSLKKARESIPGDQWIAGQLVRLNLESGDLETAVDEAMDCSSVGWWCSALRGHVLHMIGMEKQADSIWTNALYHRMTLDERCLWLDPTDVIRSDSLRREVAAMNCSTRVDFAERLWWLSDPLYLTRENERRSEHLSRQVALLLDAFSNQRLDSAYVDLVVQGLKQRRAEEKMLSGEMDSLFRYDPPNITLSRVFAPAPPGYEELVRRLGVPGYFYITRPDEGASPQLVALLPNPRFSFVPNSHAIRNHLQALPEDWQVVDDNHYEVQVMPGKEFVNLDYQVAFFRRGDSARLVAATDLSAHPRLHRGAEGALILRRDYTDTGTVIKRKLRGDLFIERAHVPRGRTYVSMEIQSRDGNLAGRVRFGAGPSRMPSQRVTVSDMMLLERRDRLPEDLEDAEALILGNQRLTVKGGASLFWEMYGLRQGEQPRVIIELRRETPGLLGTVARAVTRRPLQDQRSIHWTNPPSQGRAIEPGAVTLDLANLEPGRYTLTLAVSIEGQETVRSSRVIDLIEK